MTQGGFDFDAGIQRVAGVDEVGRGPLAGDVVAAAVILDPQQPIAGLADSKKLTAKRREALAEQIKSQALAWCVARASVAEIDELNILQASLLAMRRAVAGLSVVPEFCQIDGNRLPTGLPCPAEAVVGGDGKVEAISAASILAKVQRDQELVELDQRFPQYGFARHKGYPTAEHLAALAEHGVTDHHRRSYAPVQRALARDRTI
ncbi:ribonuclease HII [Saccharospirillum sp. MSK14-1]|uniref:ribonuclease HII n=1 Tax=Saccharospirillum sp. MSK14-1 TaxID=1897632 RepID=UPI000D3775B8|nr:ribonuclease HII [Saccharospirillum sp. MSK14-1]PTY37173.1 ribonuclease HII [Saccharospirillum sp. MSK14-1]